MSSWIYLTYARPGHGKSMDLTRTALRLLKQYDYISKKYPDLPKRKMYSNMPFSEKFEKLAGDRLVYWDSPRELYNLRHVDILWDEIARHIPADKWNETPLKLRDVFSLHRHRGLRIFANCQDYKQVDKNFRRMVAQAWRIKKAFGSRDISVTLPPPMFIYGLYVKRRFSPEDLEIDSGDKKPEHIRTIGWPRFFWGGRHLVSFFDTTYDKQRSTKAVPLDHYEQYCSDDGCSYRKVFHS